MIDQMIYILHDQICIESFLALISLTSKKNIKPIIKLEANFIFDVLI